MHIELTSRHGDVAEDVRQLIEQKARKLTHIFERVTAIQVTVDMDPRLGVEVEIVVDAEGSDKFVAHATAQDSSSDALTAFELSLHKVEGQLRRHKQRLQDHRREIPLGELARDDQDGKTDDANEQDELGEETAALADDDDQNTIGG